MSDLEGGGTAAPLGKKPHISFASIDQFRNVITRVKRHKGADCAILPIMSFQGTVKLHGTNASVCYSERHGMWFQSRNTILTPESDNCGFAKWATERSEVLESLLHSLSLDGKWLEGKWDQGYQDGVFTIFGEWCGKGIQKGVAISGLERMFVIFGACYTPYQEEGSLPAVAPQENTEEEEGGETSEASELDRKQWLDYRFLSHPESRIFNIQDFPTYSVTINFNQPKLVQNYLGELTAAVEAECPVGKHFGVSGIGEGIVWTTPDSTRPYRFKVKGEKHSVSKVKVPAEVDVEKVTGCVAFADYAATPQRFSQALSEVVGEKVLGMDQLGLVIRWVIRDIMKEEGDVLEESGLVAKDVNKYLSERVKQMFMEEMSNNG